MKDKPKGGMRQKNNKEHRDEKQDKKMVKKMVKGDCINGSYKK